MGSDGKKSELQLVVEKHKRANGRPSKLTEEIIEDVVVLLSAGNYKDTVCDFLGIDRKTFGNWYNAGKKKNGLYKKFFLAVKRAEATAEIALLAAVASGKQGWQSKSWMMERKWYNKWGRKQMVETRSSPTKQDLTLRFDPNDKSLNGDNGNGTDEHTPSE